MPYTAKQTRLFNMCANNPGRAKGKCPKGSNKLADEANRLNKGRKVNKKTGDWY